MNRKNSKKLFLIVVLLVVYTVLVAVIVNKGGDIRAKNTPNTEVASIEEELVPFKTYIPIERDIRGNWLSATEVRVLAYQFLESDIYGPYTFVEIYGNMNEEMSDEDITIMGYYEIDETGTLITYAQTRMENGKTEPWGEIRRQGIKMVNEETIELMGGVGMNSFSKVNYGGN